MRHLPALAVPLLAVLPGCVQFKQDVAHTLAPLLPAAPVEPAWGPWPEGVSVHPATRVRAEGKRWIVDTRVRMVDGLGDYTKASGVWHFELHAVGSLTQARYDLIQSWNEKVQTFDQHKGHFDAVTRAYRFFLQLDEAPMQGRSLRLLAVFTPEGSARRMAAEFDVSGSEK